MDDETRLCIEWMNVLVDENEYRSIKAKVRSSYLDDVFKKFVEFKNIGKLCPQESQVLSLLAALLSLSQ